MGSMLPYVPYMDPMGKWIYWIDKTQQQPSFGPLEKSCWKVSLGYPGCPDSGTFQEWPEIADHSGCICSP